MSLMTKFPSFGQLQASAIATWKRFPLTLICAIIGSIVAVVLVEDIKEGPEQILQRLLMCAGLGVPLFIALSLLVEKRRWPLSQAIYLPATGIVLLILYYISLPSEVTHFESVLLRYALLGIMLHFCVAFLPYLGGHQTNGFWQFNTALFRRFLIAALYAGVLYIGLAIALAAGDQLFGMDVKNVRYAQLWILMAGVIHPWLFLAGIPRDLDALDRTTDYPKGLGVFAQHILLPLVALYFAILIAYEVKIIATWNWPKGWVSELILWFAVVGVLSLLMLYPLRKEEGKRWVQTFVRWFFRCMIPLVVLLFLAILRRISEYGVTEPRYLVLLMAVGLVVITLYFLFTKKPDIRAIPILLGLSALLAAYGPWSASAVSLSSQMGRLETFLTQNQILADGVLQKASEEAPFEDRKEMSSIIRYVVNSHGPEPFEKLLGGDPLDSLDTDNRYSWPDQITGILGFEYVGPYSTEETDSTFTISAPEGYENQTSFSVTGYDYLVDFSFHDSFRQSYPLDDTYCLIDLDTLDLFLTVTIGNDLANEYDSLKLGLAGPLNSLIEKYGGETPVADRTFIMVGENHEASLVLERVYGIRPDGKLQVLSFFGHLLIRRL